jgi:carboxylesterase type B
MPGFLSAAVLTLVTVRTLAEPQVTIRFGQSAASSYRGTISNGIEHFHNIKYAYDTSGARRFAPPEPYVPEDGSTIDATAPGAACAQMRGAIPPFFVATPDISEDCLSLRIARPEGSKEGDKLPVVVYVNGGGLVKGWAEDAHSDPEKLMALTVEIGKPVIFAAFNYRMGIFGFARLPLLKEEKSLNVGMRDQRAAFGWIKQNIEAFGGDSERITAFGLSAGGTSTSLQVMAYGGEKELPFTQAWVMSGPPGTAINMSSTMTEGHTRAVATTLECDKDDDAAILECLRDVPMNKLLDSAVSYAQANFPPMGLFTFIPSTDDDFFPDRPSVLFENGKFSKDIPMVFGWTQDDGTTNAGPPNLVQTEADMIPPIARFAPLLTQSDFDALFRHYPAADFASDVANYDAAKDDADDSVSVHFWRLARILRDMLFTCSSIDFGSAMTRQTRREKPDWNGVRLYTLNQTMLTPLLRPGGMPHAGVAHGSDTSFLFNGLFLYGEVTDEDAKLSREFSTAFLHFAYTGDPGSWGVVWPPAFSRDVDMDRGGGGNDEPRELTIEVVGGTHGMGAVKLTRYSEGVPVPEGVGETLDSVQSEGLEYAAMGSRVDEEKRRRLESEKLFTRCRFLSTLAEKLGH